MNVFGTMRRVVGKLHDDDDDEVDEPNLSRKTIMKGIKIFKTPNHSHEEAEKAIEMIGHAAYISGQESNDIILPLLPNLITIVGDKKEYTSLRLQCLRSLDEICTFNKSAIDRVWKAVKLWQVLPSVIGESENLLMACWACKFTTTMTAHSMAFLKETSRIPNLLGSLQRAADYDHDWEGFDCNHAKQMLTLMGKLKVAEFQASESHRKSHLETLKTSSSKRSS